MMFNQLNLSTGLGVTIFSPTSKPVKSSTHQQKWWEGAPVERKQAGVHNLLEEKRESSNTQCGLLGSLLVYHVCTYTNPYLGSHMVAVHVMRMDDMTST